MSATQTLTRVHDHRDRRAWLESIADVVERHGEGEVLIAVDGEGPSYEGSYADARSAGDLDGDGLDDVAALHWDVRTDALTVEGRSGRDGAVLWESAVNGADGVLAWPLGEDVTGDGTADLLVYGLDILTEEYTEECEGDEEEYWCFNYDYSATYRWTVGIASGRDGAMEWSRQIDGELEESSTEGDTQSAPVAYQYEYDYSIVGTAVDVIPFVADLRGSDQAEVILNTLDINAQETYADTGVGGAVAYAGKADANGQLRAVTEIDILDASNGAELQQRTQPSEAVIAYAFPLYDRGSQADLLLERSVLPDFDVSCVYLATVAVYQEHCPTEEYGDSLLEVALLDGRSLDQRWARSFTTWWGFSDGLGGDLDADGRDDVVVLLEGDEDYELLYLAAADGTALWDATDNYVVAIAQLDDVPGDDLITARWTYDYTSPSNGTETETETMTISRRSGRTGEARGEQSWSATSKYDNQSETYRWLNAGAIDDVDGDGIPDITVTQLAFRFTCDWESEDEECTEESLGSWSEAISGLAPRTLYRAASDGVVRLGPTGDFDGDGVDELGVRTTDYLPDSQQSSFTPVRVGDGSALWTASATGDGVYWVVGGDMDGDGGHDLLRHVDSVNGNRLQTVVTALNGRTGASGWSFASRP